MYPIKVCEEELDDHRDLLFITRGQQSHYCYIENFNAFVAPQLHKRTAKTVVCKRCFAYFEKTNTQTPEERLLEHRELCIQFKPVKAVFPQKSWIRFNDFYKSQKVRFVIYCDFESILTPVKGCENNSNISWTWSYQIHKPYSYCYLVKDKLDKYTELKLYRGEDAAQHFMHSIRNEAQKIDKILFLIINITFRVSRSAVVSCYVVVILYFYIFFCKLLTHYCEFLGILI
mgnify:CR=1 FL=1